LSVLAQVIGKKDSSDDAFWSRDYIHKGHVEEWVFVYFLFCLFTLLYVSGPKNIFNAPMA